MSGAAAPSGAARAAVRNALKGQAGIVLGYLALAAAVFHEAFLPGRAFASRDVHLFWMPGIEGFVRAVGGGEWPLWDPVFSFGKPLLADPGLQLAYPPTWLNLLVPPETYYELFIVAHLAWAGWGACRLARHWGLPRLAAWSAGAFFACSGPVVSALSLWHHFAGTTWVPWVLLALERLLERPGPRRAALLAAAAAAQSLAGSADLCLMTGGLCALRVLAAWRGPGRARRLAWAAASVPLAAGLAAVQWAPTLATLETSTRAAMDPEAFSYWSLHPAQLVELVFPLPLSWFALEPALRERLFGGRESFLASIHPGIGVLGLAALGLAAPGPRRRLRNGLWLALALLVLAALGRHGFLQPILGLLPGFDAIRYPQKFLLPASLFLAAAAACGVARWLEPWSAAQQAAARRVGAAGALLGLLLAAAAGALWARPAFLEGVVVGPLVADAAATAASALAVAAGTALLAAGALLARSTGPVPPPRLTALALALTLGQLVYASTELCGSAPRALVAGRPSLVAPLLEEPGPVRLQVVAPPDGWLAEHTTRSPPGWSAPETEALGRVESLSPPIPARWGIDGAFWGTFTGQEHLVYSSLTGIAHQQRDTAGTRLLQMAGVSHLVSVEPAPYPGLTEVASIESLFDRPVRLFRVPAPAPRAFAVGGVVVADEPRSYELLRAGAVDHRRSVILPEGTPRPPGDGFRSEVRTLWRRTASVGLEAEVSGDGTLVLLDAWDPGWTVEVDGVARALLRANLIFRGVALAPGRHRVVFRYRPREAAVGFWVTLAALTVAAVLVRRREA